jgi:hypothetical protein
MRMDGMEWNGIANFQCSMWSVHDLDQANMKDISVGSQNLMKLNAITRHICIRFISPRSPYGCSRTNTRSCKAIDGSLIEIKFPRHISRLSKDSFIKPYITFQPLINYWFPKI